MKIFGRTEICLSLLIAFCSLTLGQSKFEDNNAWLIRATTITDDLVKDASSLTPNERALLWARIGQAWAKDDPDRAAIVMRRAVEIVELAPDQENDAERRQRLETARSLLSIIPPQDSKLRLRLEALFVPAENQATGNRGRENAEGMVAAAMAIVDTDPQRAFDLGVTSLRLGKTYKLAPLLWSLRKRNSKLADGLFDQALAAAKATFDAESLSWLGQFAFHGQTPSDERRKALLAVMAEGLLRNSASGTGEAEVCRFAVTVAPLLNQFLRLLPFQWGAVRAATQRCQQSLPSFSRQSVDEALRDHPAKTVADLESDADKAPSQEIRDEYLIRAASLAAQQKDFEQAISLLDLISDVGRRSFGGGWESWRWEYASLAALAQLKRGDRPAMYRIITATPADLRGLVEITVVQELAKVGDPSSAIDLLNDARQRLSHSSGAEVIDGYFSLVREYENLMPIDALNVFNEAVKALNRAEKADAKAKQTLEAETSVLSNDLLLGPYNVPVTLLQRDEQGLRAAISSIESPSKRTAIRLNLLAAALARHRTTRPENKAGTPKAAHPFD